jgi:glycosyltransferase involved in cell wall biosynthesis
MASNTLPLVSVCIIAYNHEKYIRDAIEGVLMQKVNFEYELIIGDDCSTDNTRKILLEYQSKYPSKVKLLLHEKNLGFLGKKNHIEILKNSTGKYIAQLDGDDYWTYENKLQQQIDFLEQNHDFAICFHKARWFIENNPDYYREYPASQKTVTTIETLSLEGNYIPTSSIVFRNKFDFNKIPSWIYEDISGDWAFNHLMAQYGKIYFIDEIWSLYRVHEKGHWVKKADISKSKAYINTKKYLNMYFKNAYAKELLLHTRPHYFQLLNYYILEKRRAKALSIWFDILCNYNITLSTKNMIYDLCLILNIFK